MSAEPGLLSKRDGEPLFAEPWQAQVMALAAQLVEAGAITAGDWAEALGAEIRQAEQAGESDHSASYFSCVLKALEKVLQSENLLTKDDLAARKDSWIRAFKATPHGQPVALSAGQKT